MLTNLKKDNYTRSWENPEDFPSWQSDEETVRFDMQYLFEEIRQWVNNLIDSIKGANIPFGPVAGIAGDSVEDGMIDMKRQLDEAVIGGLVPDHSVTLEKLDDDVLEKMEEPVGTDRLVDECVTEDKIAENAVNTVNCPNLQARRIRIISGEVKFNGQSGVFTYPFVTSDSAVMAVPTDGSYADWTAAGVHYYSASAGQVNFRSVTNLGTRSLFAHMVILN